MLLFTVIPLAELGLLVYLGTLIGLWNTIIIVVATGITGAVLSRSQGIAVLRRIRNSLEQGAMPSDGIFDGALILVAGLLLITPGVVTDLIGFALLIPATRRCLKTPILRYLRRKVESGDVLYWHMHRG